MEGTSFDEDLAVLAATAPVLRRVLARLHQARSDQLGPVFAELDAFKTLAGAGQVGVLDQALTRGTCAPRMRRRRPGGSGRGRPTGPVARRRW